MASLRGAARALLLLAVALAAAAPPVRAQIVVEDAQRKIDISTFRARVQTGMTIKNTGKAAVSSLLQCCPSELMAHAAMFEVVDGDGKSLTGTEAAAAAPAGAPDNAVCREFALPAPLQAGATLKVTAWAVFTHLLRPEPAQIKQDEPQRVVFEGDALLYSPYKVEKQTTEVVVGPGELLSFTEASPFKATQGAIAYGPYTAAAAFSSKPISVHYENSAPFAQATHLELDVHVSHWGSVQFEERYSLRHAGPKVVGEWSRFDLMVNPKEFAQAAIPGLSAVLPPSARGLYYRDEIGNISSSETRVTGEAVAVNLMPRYPLFGGWAIKFIFGWTLPLRDAVRKDPVSGRSVLMAPMGPAVRDLVVDELTVRVVLPEGARDPTVTSQPKLAAEPAITRELTYLDVVGRPVVVLRARNIVPEANPIFSVEYTHSSLGLLQKPLLLMAAFAALIAAAMVLGRNGASLGNSPSMQALVKPHAS